MVNRVHPLTRKVIEINKGFDLEALHRAVARIEHVQGWRREARGRYRVQADGTVQRVNRSAPVGPRSRFRPMVETTGEIATPAAKNLPSGLPPTWPRPRFGRPRAGRICIPAWPPWDCVTSVRAAGPCYGSATRR